MLLCFIYFDGAEIKDTALLLGHFHHLEKFLYDCKLADCSLLSAFLGFLRLVRKTFQNLSRLYDLGLNLSCSVKSFEVKDHWAYLHAHCPSLACEPLAIAMHVDAIAH